MDQVIADTLQQIATSLAAQDARAAEAAAEQRVREGYGYTLTKAKTVLHPPFLVTMMLYPCVIAFSLQARSNRFNLLIPTPAVPGTPLDQMALTGPNNQWRTQDDSCLSLTIFSFITVMCLHAYILTHLRIRGPPGAMKMVASLAWLPTMSFWGATTTYFIAYISMSRYEIVLFEIVFTSVCSILLLGLTLLLLLKPIRHDTVVKARNVDAQA